MMGKKIFALLTVLVFLGAFTFPVWAEGDEDTEFDVEIGAGYHVCLLYTSPSPRDRTRSRMPSSA